MELADFSVCLSFVKAAYGRDDYRRLDLRSNAILLASFLVLTITDQATGLRSDLRSGQHLN